MPESQAGGWAALNGEEIINSQRTITYIKNFGLPLTVSQDCWCMSIQDLLGDCPNLPVTGYRFPSTDPAPWYDPATPESGDFLGFLPTEVDGLDTATYKRTVTNTINSGGVLGRLIAQPRTITWKGYLFGRTCCAVDYGLHWLISKMANAGGCDSCQGAELDTLYCCPATTAQAANVASCNQASSGVPPLGVIKNADAFRNLQRVGLSDGPKVDDKRTIGCSNCDTGTGCMYHIEFSLVAGDPFLYRDPIDVCQLSWTCPGPNCIEWIVADTPVIDPATGKQAMDANGKPITVCDFTCVDVADCTHDPNCSEPTLPPAPAYKDDCACDPLDPTTVTCYISANQFGKFFEAVPSISIFSGDNAIRNVKIDFFENPQQRPCDQIDNECFKCDSVEIRYIPANTTITIDGTSRSITATCVGGAPLPAENLTVSPFNWPVIKCIDYCISFTADCAITPTIAPNNTIDVQIVPREM